MKNHGFVSTNKAALELFTEFKFHEVQLMSLYYYCVIKMARDTVMEQRGQFWGVQGRSPWWGLGGRSPRKIFRTLM